MKDKAYSQFSKLTLTSYMSLNGDHYKYHWFCFVVNFLRPFETFIVNLYAKVTDSKNKRLLKKKDLFSTNWIECSRPTNCRNFVKLGIKECLSKCTLLKMLSERSLMYFNTEREVRLVGHVVSAHDVQGTLDCLQLCVRTIACRSLVQLSFLV